MMRGQPYLSEAERLERDVDGRPSVKFDDPLLATLKQEHRDRWLQVLIGRKNPGPIEGFDPAKFGRIVSDQEYPG